MPGGGDVESHIRLQLDGTHEEVTGGDEDGTTAVPGTCVDGGLYGCGIESLAVALSAMVADVVEAGARGIGGDGCRTSGRSLGCKGRARGH